MRVSSSCRETGNLVQMHTIKGQADARRFGTGETKVCDFSRLLTQQQVNSDHHNLPMNHLDLMESTLHTPNSVAKHKIHIELAGNAFLKKKNCNKNQTYMYIRESFLDYDMYLKRRKK